MTWSAKETGLAVLLGLAGFVVNNLELQLGWGMHFVFGNALVYAFLRVLAPQSIILAAAISSVRTIFLWNHPWAWIVWVVEAAFIVFCGRKNSPVRNDVIFWLVLGAPLLLLTYGVILKMDELSLLLVLAKQSTNGILNVVLGEAIYLCIVGLNVRQRFSNWPKLPVESFVTTLLMAVILIPTTVYLALDAPSRERDARHEVSRQVESRLMITRESIHMWAYSRALVLKIYAEQAFAPNVEPRIKFLNRVSAEFDVINVTLGGRRITWSAAPGESFIQMPAEGALSDAVPTGQAVRLVALTQKTAKHGSELALLVPFAANGEEGLIIARLRHDVLYRLAAASSRHEDDGLFLVSAKQGTLPITQVKQATVDRVAALKPEERNRAISAPLLVTRASYGNAIMSDLRDAQILRAAAIPMLPEWQVVAIAALAPSVLRAREVQLTQFAALFAFVVFVALFASVLSKIIAQTFRRLAQSAADLAIRGADRGQIDSLMIQELNEISGTIASAGVKFRTERGALENFQRRLNNFARNAPVIGYAVDIVNGVRETPIYISPSIEKLGGYSAADMLRPGAWIAVLHPDDLSRCLIAFQNLKPKDIVNVEYRIRHRAGHYLWVLDTLSVEAVPGSENLEGVGVLVDISERKAATEQLLQADKMASLGRMIAGTAHELNQPLNFIKMAASNLLANVQRGNVDVSRVVDKMEGVLRQVDRASAIILQMRVFGRTPTEQPAPIDVETVIQGVILMVAPQFELDGTDVELAVKKRDVRVEALSVQFEQVLLNVLINANDSIRARHASGDSAGGLIKITVDRTASTAVINIDDNGTGLPDDVLPMLFEPFFTTKAPKEGTGLGLSISYGIIRDLGGSIRAQNGATGAQFTIELPLAPVETDKKARATKPGATAARIGKA
jgi:PAS domain S-box-containing protein